MKRYAIFFDRETEVKGVRRKYDGSKGVRTFTTRKANGVIDAYRKATGYTGPLSKSRGGLRQQPIAMVQPYVKNILGLTPKELGEAYKSLPPHAYIVPITE